MTLIETTIAISLLAAVAGGAASVLDATSGLARRSHADLDARQTARRALERIVDALRSADPDTLSGFDADGVATAPQFQPVVGASATAILLGPVTRIEWRAAPGTSGTAVTGDIVLVRDGMAKRVARCVPAGGFLVTQTGNSLHVHLEIAPASAGTGGSSASFDASVTLRN